MKLLLHACCGPCSLEPTRLLKAAGHDITIYYANSNIHPAEEYEHRLATLRAWARMRDSKCWRPVRPGNVGSVRGRIGDAAIAEIEQARAKAGVEGECEVEPGALTTPPATGVRRLPIQRRKPFRMPQRQRQWR